MTTGRRENVGCNSDPIRSIPSPDRARRASTADSGHLVPPGPARGAAHRRSCRRLFLINEGLVRRHSKRSQAALRGTAPFSATPAVKRTSSSRQRGYQTWVCSGQGTSICRSYLFVGHSLWRSRKADMKAPSVRTIFRQANDTDHRLRGTGMQPSRPSCQVHALRETFPTQEYPHA